jgi:hypothetical protein
VTDLLIIDDIARHVVRVPEDVTRLVEALVELDGEIDIAHHTIDEATSAAFQHAPDLYDEDNLAAGVPRRR